MPPSDMHVYTSSGLAVLKLVLLVMRDVITRRLSDNYYGSFEWQDGCIVCPSTESTYDLKSGKVKEWMPTNPVLRVLTPSLRDLVTYPVKVEDESIYINVRGGGYAEIVFGGAASGNAGRTATNIDVDEACSTSVELCRVMPTLSK